MAKTYDPFKNVQDVMTKAMEIGHIDTTMFDIIKNPQRETKVYLPVEMDDGTVKVFEGYRVQHSNIRGPFKGGIRYHQDCILKVQDLNGSRLVIVFFMQQKTSHFLLAFY